MPEQWIDISREWLSAPVYPGDPEPTVEKTSDMHLGDACSVSMIHACLHTGTHVDAPCHFWEAGGDVESIPLSSCIGECLVIEATGTMVGETLESFMWLAPKRVLFKGDVTLSQSAAFVLIDAGVRLVGVEGTSVAPFEAEEEVHKLLLSSNVAILEGLDLSAVDAGRYILNAVPIRIAGADGAPVRALLAPL